MSVLNQEGHGYQGAARVLGCWLVIRGGRTWDTAAEAVEAVRKVHTMLGDEDIRAVHFHPGDDRCTCVVTIDGKPSPRAKCSRCGGTGYV
ncbi:MAG: hypothetical protein ACYTBJ_21770 [Planctomycetota bacterium]|jgi:hypothetical protein